MSNVSRLDITASTFSVAVSREQADGHCTVRASEISKTKERLGSQVRGLRQQIRWLEKLRIRPLQARICARTSVVCGRGCVTQRPVEFRRL